MKYSVSRMIHASPEVVWSILTRAEAYPEWDPGMIRLEGEIAPGETIKAFTKLSPGRAFPARITEFVPNRSMVWTGGMPLGLFKGVRTFSLIHQDDGTTRFEMDEVFSGLLLKMIARTMPDLTESFEQFADGLKARAENET